MIDLRDFNNFSTITRGEDGIRTFPIKLKQIFLNSSVIQIVIKFTQKHKKLKGSKIKLFLCVYLCVT